MGKSKFSLLVTNLDLAVACLALAILIAVTVSGVAMRYLVNDPLKWMEEVQMALIVWIVFLSSGNVARTSGHVAIDAFVGIFPAGLRRATEIVVHGASICALAFMCFYAWKFVNQMYTRGRLTNLLEIPYYMVYAVVPLAFVLTGLHEIAALIRAAAGRTAIGDNSAG